MPKFWTKSALFGYILARTLENYCHIWYQHLRINVIATFFEETKITKFGTKNALLDIIDQEFLIWVFLGKNFLKKLLSYLKSAPSNLSIWKILRKNKIA